MTATLSSAHMKPSPDTSIGTMLVAAGKISPDNSERVLRMQKELNIRYGEAAQRLGLVSETDIQQVLARQFDYPYLQQGDGDYSPLLAAAFQPFSPQVEVLRAVRNQLMLRWFSQGHKALVVAGVASGDGASVFTANLAIVFSQLGEQTLLVDANLRAPRQHDLFGVKRRQGLSDILAGRAELSTVARIDDFIDLSVLCAGTLPPNPQELLSRSGFAALNAQLSARYDAVLYDVPAFERGSDALALAARAGGVLLVARKNHTPLEDVQALVTQVRHTGAEVVGAVMVEF
ncbi:chain length determinant protein tyrosine kinase EpsG [Duganella sp. FT92W]|uniref:Chain length determinant protein tyrosine kinase EpsG n=1 Tax=Pseudoduganella rivuli TaxID=2666085 RepID=A0A7X2LUA1_9BURK|nr:chain length determinant protein tyrosine kinase EpsG [Pseudoduganella rivuli]MRV74176.1 chain length determinant protein tyrosine kinase EpsG [Pseudoduganella rivuli]